MKAKKVWRQFYRNNQINRLINVVSSRFFSKPFSPISANIKNRLLSHDAAQEKIRILKEPKHRKIDDDR